MKFDWNEVKTFNLIAQYGGLNSAAKKTTMSPATLNRKINAFESRFPKPLFTRSHSGYKLTQFGSELLQRTKKISAEMIELETWKEQQNHNQLVSISAGPWTCSFLSKNISNILGEFNDSEYIDLKFLSNNLPSDIKKRNVDIGIRNQRPTEIGLAGQKIGDIAYSLYCTKKSAKSGSFIAPTEDYETPSAKWIRREYKNKIELTSNSNESILQMILAGAGIGVLPCFIGDSHQMLIRYSNIIQALSHEQWLVLNDETRHQKHIQRVTKSIAILMENNKKLLTGELIF